MDQRMQDALAWVNTKRVERGLEPLGRLPHGRAADGEECPVARGLGIPGALVGRLAWNTAEDIVGGFIPNEVADFIDAFDAGEYPELLVVA